MERSDTQPDNYIQTTSANTEVNALTDRLETDLPTEKKPAEFQNRLEALVEHLESQYVAKKNTQIRSFTNQPERVNISSDNDISIVQSQSGVNEETFNSFKVAIARPFLDVKSIQLLRASIPNAVTNIPDEECTFWYYRLPIATFSGTVSISIPGVAGYSNASFTNDGVITAPVITATLISITPSFPSVGSATYFLSNLTGLANGSSVTVAGVTPQAGYNGTFIISDISVPNVSFRVVNATTGVENVSAATLTQNMPDVINWGSVPYSVTSGSGVVRGYFTYPSTNPGTVNIYTSPTLTGGTVGTITRSSDLFLPAPSYKYLHMIRLLPSYYKAELFDNAFGQDTDLPPASLYGFNKTFTDYTDLETELSKSCTDDPGYDAQIAIGNTFPIFIPNDISITFNQTLNKFIFTGNNTFDSTNTTQYMAYLSAGYQDDNLWVQGTALYPTEIESAPTLEYFTTNDIPGDYVNVRGIKGQPYKLYKTLNLRLGFTWNGIISSISTQFPLNLTALQAGQIDASLLVSFLNRLRGVPSYYYNPAPAPPALSQTSPTYVDKYTADSYANLVYTNTVSLYADFTGGSTYDSMKDTQLLACVPMNASNLGVTFYNTSIFCPLTKISDQIYEIEIRMLTDTGSPYIIPNSCIVSLELALTY